MSIWASCPLNNWELTFKSFFGWKASLFEAVRAMATTVLAAIASSQEILLRKHQIAFRSCIKIPFLHF